MKIIKGICKELKSISSPHGHDTTLAFKCVINVQILTFVLNICNNTTLCAECSTCLVTFTTKIFSCH